MKNILSFIVLTLCTLVLFVVVYPLIIWGFAQLAPNHGRGDTLQSNYRTVGYRTLGQSFTEERFFWGRPSAVAYNAAGSCGSNKGPSNPAYLEEVQVRLDSFMAHHAYLDKSLVPAEMITASGSGLDPDISPASARIQVQRVAQARNLPADQVAKLVEDNVRKPFLGIFGPSTVNVLRLNIALDALKQ